VGFLPPPSVIALAAVSPVADADQRIAAASGTAAGSQAEIASDSQTNLSAVNFIQLRDFRHARLDWQSVQEVAHVGLIGRGVPDRRALLWQGAGRSTKNTLSSVIVLHRAPDLDSGALSYREMDDPRARQLRRYASRKGTSIGFQEAALRA